MAMDTGMLVCESVWLLGPTALACGDEVLVLQLSDPVSRDHLMPTRAVARRRIYRRRRQVVGGGLLLCIALIVLVGFKISGARTLGQVVSAVDSSPAPIAAQVTPQATAPNPNAAFAPPSLKSPSPSPSPLATARPGTMRATGKYAAAPGVSVRRGSGTLVTYRVDVETGTRQSAPVFAAAVDATLAHPSGWTGQGRWSLQRADRDGVDFVIRLATPATVDKVCATAGLETRGYVSCRVANFVMINIDRWLSAVPDYRGDVALYRQYVINHEVGHQLGYGHQACPGSGRLAPVMQQQTLGLKGCRKNGWPYVDGVFVPGPATR